MIEDKQYKVVMLGSGAVGKSAITVQMVSGHFLSSYDPTIEDSYRTTINVNNKDIILNIIDTAGQEEFYALRDQYIRSGDGYIIVFSITSVTSFLEVNAIKNQLNMVLDVDNNTYKEYIALTSVLKTSLLLKRIFPISPNVRTFKKIRRNTVFVL